MLVALTLLASSFITGCARQELIANGSSNRDSLSQATQATNVADPDSISRVTITPDPIDDGREQPSNTGVLAERLGRLDAMIRNATPDSARALRDEYRRLLAEYTGESPDVATGSEPSVYNPATQTVQNRNGATASRQRFDTIRASDHSRSRRIRAPQQPRSSEQPRSTSAVASRRSRASRPRSTERPTTRSQRSRRHAADGRSRSSSELDGSDNNASRNAQREYVDGVAAVRAGEYNVAIEELPKAIHGTGLSERHRTRARYEYGTALERSGRPREAARAYSRAARGDAATRDRATVARARALARSGNRDRARTMLRNFIKANPKSRQVVTARRLLQTL